MDCLKRNWRIDLLRFVFAICVLLFHFRDQMPSLDHGIRLGWNGYIGVEFFFVLSGYLLAKKILTAKGEIGVFDIAKSKLLSFYWMWVIAIILKIGLDLSCGITEGYERFIGDLLLLYSTGMTDVKLGFGWYLSSMMLVTIVLTPILLKVKKREKLKQDFVYLLVIEMCAIGYLFSIGGTEGIFMRFNVRAFSEMLLGALLFIYRQNVRKPIEGTGIVLHKIWAALLQIVAYIYLLIFINKTYPEKGYGEMIALICIAVIVYFSFEHTSTDRQISKPKEIWVYLCVSLGKISLPIYLFHDIVKKAINVYFPDMNAFKKLSLIITATIWLSVVVLLLKYLYDNVVACIKSTKFPSSDKKQCLSYVAIVAVATVLCPVSSAIIEANVSDSFTVVKNSVSYSDVSSTIKCYTGTTVSEEFFADEDLLISDISFYTITWNKDFADDQTLGIVIRNKDTNEEVYNVTKKMSEFVDGRVYPLVPDEKIRLSGDSWYTIEFVPTTSESQEYMALMMTKSSDNSGKAYINGRQTDEHISMQILCSGA